MDILLGDDANGFDLELDATGDLTLINDNRTRLINSIKIALFSQDNWHTNDLLKIPTSSIIDELVRLPVNEGNRLLIQDELAQLLSFISREDLAQSLVIEVRIVNNRNYIFRLVVDGEALDFSALLEVRE